MADHVEALWGWIRSGGFAPSPVWRPVDVAPCFADLPFERDITVSGRGLECRGSKSGTDEWVLVHSWHDLAFMAEQADEV